MYMERCFYEPVGRS